MTEPQHSTSPFSLPNGQSGEIDIVAELTTKPWEGDTYLALDLRNSRIAPGEMQDDSINDRGYFIERVVTTMTPTASDVAPGNLHSTVFVYNSGAATSASAGSTSSSTGFNLGANAGMFGDTPTTGLSAGVSQTESNSVETHSFVSKDRSDSLTIRHEYALAMNADGSSYGKPEDVVDGNALPYPKLRPIIPMATTTLSLIDYGQWMVEGQYSGIVTISLQIEVDLMKVHLHNSHLPWPADNICDGHYVWSSDPQSVFASGKFDFVVPTA